MLRYLHRRPVRGFSCREKETNLLAAVGHLVLARHVLLDGWVLVLRRGSAGLEHVEQNAVAQLVLELGGGGGRARVHEVVAGVLARQVGEPQVALGVERHPRVVDGLETVRDILHDPVHFGLGPAVGRLAAELEGLALRARERRRRRVLERVQLGFAHEHGVRGGHAELVLGEALVLADVLVLRLRDGQRAAARVLRDAVIVRLVLEVLAVLDPPVPIRETGVIMPGALRGWCMLKNTRC